MADLSEYQDRNKISPFGKMENKLGCWFSSYKWCKKEKNPKKKQKKQKTASMLYKYCLNIK